MDYEKKYNEALKRAKQHLHYSNNKAYVEVGEIFPELRESDEQALRIIKKRMCYDPVPISDEDRRIVENYLEKQKESLHISETCKENADSFTSEDERIRKALIDLVSTVGEYYLPKLEARNKMLAYLEKQKEPHYTKRNALFDKCVENCDPKTVEEVNKRVDDIMNMPELSAFEQALTNFIGYWEDDEERWPSQFVKKYGKHILDMAREELQKEQKPAEGKKYSSPECGITAGVWSEKDEKRIQRICDFLWKNRKGDTDTIYQIEKDAAWLKSLRPQPKSVWSDEDDQLIGFIFDLLNDLFWRKDWAMSKEECLERLKSLRPQNLPTWERDIPETHDPYTWFVRNGYRISIDDLWKKLPKKEGEEKPTNLDLEKEIDDAGKDVLRKAHYHNKIYIPVIDLGVEGGVNLVPLWWRENKMSEHPECIGVIEYIRKDAIVELMKDCMRSKPRDFQLDVQEILDKIIHLNP